MFDLELELEIFNKLFTSVPEEMGIILRYSSFSPNIRERADFSCAIFDEKGELLAQASHIPVHLGAMPETIREILPLFDWSEGDMVITNDPYRGGTHLPDITLIKPVFFGNRPCFYLIIRAHHADVGGKYPGSMGPVEHIKDEGILIEPTLIFHRGRLNRDLFEEIISSMRNPTERCGDFKAMFSALDRGEIRLRELINKYGIETLISAGSALKNYTEKAILHLFKKTKSGTYYAVDYMDCDGYGNEDIPIRVTLTVNFDGVKLDFTQSADQVRGPLNAPRGVTVSAVYYVFISLLKTLGDFPINHGLFRRIEISTRRGSILDAEYPAPVSGGNVETSQRVVDVILKALAEAIPELVPAGSCGTMNNITFGRDDFAYYETIGGGMGARPGKDGLSAVHCHMTNTLNTPIEALEQLYPVKILRYSIRRGSGGEGKYRGGDGLIREFLFEEDLIVTLLTERRRHAPYGLWGGNSGKVGQNILIRDGKEIELPGKTIIEVKKGDRLVIMTPGGGGWGKKS